MIREQVRPAFISFLLLTLITGVFYPLSVTGFAQVFFKAKADGSLLLKDGQAVGSSLIGQTFDDVKYFWGRPSATTPSYNASSSSGSNYGPMQADYLKAVQDRIKALKEADISNEAAIPVDLVTASGSGLDPDISIAAARYQAARIARVRGMDPATVLKLVRYAAEGPQIGIFGEARVNVLKLNLLLDRLQKDPSINIEKPEPDPFPENMKWGNWENPRALNSR